MIDPGSGVPAWRQMADDLRQRILRGEFAPGQRLPSEPDLGHEYGVGRTTVRRAVAALRAEGLIVVQHGWGTRVRPASETQEIAGESGMVVSCRMPTPEERATLGLADGVPMLVISTPDGFQDAYPGDVTHLRIP
ncbi:winged helix-turn-helix domain-containing protein [Micromonosporaceae bacterium B7E4]